MLILFQYLFPDAKDDYVKNKPSVAAESGNTESSGAEQPSDGAQVAASASKHSLADLQVRVLLQAGMHHGMTNHVAVASQLLS